MTVSLDTSTRPQRFAESLRAADPSPLPLGIGPADGAAGTTVLVAEDDPTCRRALQHYLRRAGYHVGEATSVTSTLEAVASQADLVIVDLDQEGRTAEALSKIRHTSSVPVIVCSGRATERDRVSLFNLGADDFLSKPFSFAELEARVRAVLRRGSAAPTTTLEHGDLVIDQGTRTVRIGVAEVPMTRKEFDLLAFLAAAPGKVFSRDDLLERVWGSNGRWQGRSTVTEHIRRVRLKIEADPESPRWITTIRGIGYRFAAPSGVAAGAVPMADSI
jgi:DNA-binding response OmpR family regulator